MHPLNANVLLAIPLLPLIAAVVTGLGGRLIGRAGAHTIACLAVGVSCLLSLSVLKQVYFDGAPLYDAKVYTCTHSDTKVTTANISAVRRSIRKPTSMCIPSLTSQLYTGAS